MAKLFTAVHAAKTLNRVVNAEAQYYALLARAKASQFRVNNTLLQTVRSFERLITNALKHGNDLNELRAQGYFDASLDEYKRLCKKETASETKEWIDAQKAKLAPLVSLGKDMTPLVEYYDGMYSSLVMPMQAFDKMLSNYFGSDVEYNGSRLIQGTFGIDDKDVALKEYQRSEQIQRYISGYRASIKSPVGSDKFQNAIIKMHESSQSLKDMMLSIECKHSEINGKIVINTTLTTKALPPVNPNITTGKAKKVKA